MYRVALNRIVLVVSQQAYKVERRPGLNESVYGFPLAAFDRGVQKRVFGCLNEYGFREVYLVLVIIEY